MARASRAGASEQPRAAPVIVLTCWPLIREVVLIVARAHAAAELYDDLRRRSDIDLAARGLKRADLARVALNELTMGR
jgi:hypothetical protein